MTVAGLVLVRQRPGTAKGVIFMTLEDEAGVANVIVWPKAFERLRAIVLGARLVAVTGKLQNEQGVIHVVADRMEDLTPMLGLLSEEGGTIDPSARADEVKRPQMTMAQKRQGNRFAAPPRLDDPARRRRLCRWKRRGPARRCRAGGIFSDRALQACCRGHDFFPSAFAAANGCETSARSMVTRLMPSTWHCARTFGRTDRGSRALDPPLRAHDARRSAGFQRRDVQECEAKR